MNSVSTPVEVLSFQFRRQLDTNFSFDTHTIVALVSAILLYLYLIFRTYKCTKDKVDLKPAMFSFLVYVGVIFIMYIASKVMGQDILFSRYLLVMTGLYIFCASYLLSKENNKIVLGIICLGIIILGIESNITNMQLYYNKANTEIYDYLNEEIKEDDIIVYSNIGNGGVVASLFPDNKQYFLCDPSWDVMEAYKAYGPGMQTLYNLEDGHDYSFLDDYSGRIWLIDSENMGLYNEFPKENIKILKEAKRIETTYHEYIYSVMLLEKGI